MKWNKLLYIENQKKEKLIENITNWECSIASYFIILLYVSAKVSNLCKIKRVLNFERENRNPLWKQKRELSNAQYIYAEILMHWSITYAIIMQSA